MTYKYLICVNNINTIEHLIMASYIVNICEELLWSSRKQIKGFIVTVIHYKIKDIEELEL